jgi:GNAT superfamily N-acetyltransferase
MSVEDVSVRIVDEYTPEVAVGIGSLLPALSSSRTGEPVNEDLLRAIIESPDRDQFVAEQHGRIVGAATLNLVMGPMGRKAWLEDFVTSSDESVRGKGVGFKLWSAMKDWCLSRDVYLEFTSRPSRTEAHAFYERQGAVIRDTTAFRAEFKD